MLIAVQWPDGKYSLPQAKSGCPPGWSSGWRYQDDEDDDNHNSWEPPNLGSYMKIGLGANYKTYYCTKTFDGNSGFVWPRGKYCIARYGGKCPSGFFNGSVYWDDEDHDNTNSYQNPIPDGDYGRNTRVQYCCRSDGDPSKGVFLPPPEEFILYRYEGICQKVLGMKSPVQLKLRFDDADGDDNVNSCSGNHPDGSCGVNHEIYLCFYSP